MHRPKKNHPVISVQNQIQRGIPYTTEFKESMIEWHTYQIETVSFWAPTLPPHESLYAFDDRVSKTRARIDIHEVRVVVFLTPSRVKNIEGCRCVTTGLHTFGQVPFSCEELQHLEALAWQVTHVEDISFHMILVVL